MDQTKMLKQMIKFNKTAFDNAFKALEMARDQNEVMIDAFIDQATGMPEEAKKAVRDWLATYKKGSSDFKAMVDKAYEQVDTYL